MKREPQGSRSRFRPRSLRAALAGVALILTGCSELPLPVLGADGLSPASGWVVAPTERWLTEPGVTPETVLFCAIETCADQVLVARFALTGREQEIARRVADQPERVFANLPAGRRAAAGATSRSSGRQVEQAPPPRISRFSLGAWSGARIALESRKVAGRAAHLVVLARPGDHRLLIVVAPDAQRAEEAARAAAR